MRSTDIIHATSQRDASSSGLVGSPAVEMENNKRATQDHLVLAHSLRPPMRLHFSAASVQLGLDLHSNIHQLSHLDNSSNKNRRSTRQVIPSSLQWPPNPVCAPTRSPRSRLVNLALTRTMRRPLLLRTRQPSLNRPLTAALSTPTTSPGRTISPTTHPRPIKTYQD